MSMGLTGHRRRRKSPLPLSLAVYLENPLSPGRRPLTPGGSGKNRLFSTRFEEGKVGKGEGIRRRQRNSVESSRPVSDLAVITLDDDILRAKVEAVQGQIAALQRQHLTLLRENQQLKVEKTRNWDYAVAGEPWDRESTLNEAEELYLLLSNAHKTINSLQNQHKSALLEVEKVTQELGMLKYGLELGENTKEVKVALLTEAISNRFDDQIALHRNIRELRSECIVTDQELEDFHQTNSRLCLQLQELEQRSSPDSLDIAHLYGKLAIATALLAKTEERVAACQAFINLHSAS